MKTNVHPSLDSSSAALEAESIIDRCVHCGFCTATCPTYLELGDERDGPRGRIYLIKQYLETATATQKTVTHLDRCLTCRSCETTCPSNVEYGRLVDLARYDLEILVQRPLRDRFIRWTLLNILPYRKRFGALLSLGQFLRPLLPASLAREIPERQARSCAKQGAFTRSMIALGGCAQASATPNTNAAATRVLNRLGVNLVESRNAGCCGAANYHLSSHQQARQFARNNIDAWWPHIEEGAEAVVVTASGCGTMVKDYASLLRDDKDYSEKARVVSRLARDISEVLPIDALAKLKRSRYEKELALHSPCSLQHGLKLGDRTRLILKGLGVTLTKTDQDHLCCGSAGTYSILHPRMSRILRENKVAALTRNNPQEIATANVGCQMHLAAGTQIPVKHWIEIVDEVLD